MQFNDNLNTSGTGDALKKYQYVPQDTHGRCPTCGKCRCCGGSSWAPWITYGTTTNPQVVG